VSLLDAFLLDSASLDVWVAARTDSVLGSGTEDDPYDGSVRVTPQITVSNIQSSGSTTATVTALSHGFQNLQLVQILGVPAPDASYYNGSFVITYISPNSFSFTMYAAHTANVSSAGMYCQSEPYFFDGVMRSLPIAITSLNNGGSGNIAFAAALYHGFSVGSIVTISGATGPDAYLYNGTFALIYVSFNEFAYTMSSTPSGAAGGNPYCRLSQFDAAARLLPGGPPLAVRLGPGTFQTKGYSNSVAASWLPRSGMKILGSGAEISVLQLVGGVIDQAGYTAISSPYNQYLDTFEASDFTVDCNIAGQPSLLTTCGAIAIVGKHTRIRRIRAINWGRQNVNAECFVLAAAQSHPDNPECYDCWIADCILEQPGLNNYREATLTIMSNLGERSYDGLMVYHRACVIRNCFANCEFRQNPVQISGISYSGTTGVFNVATRRPHGHANNDWLRITGAVLTDTNNSFNGSYQMTRIDDYNFQYTPSPSQPSTAAPTGDMWVGRFPSQWIRLINITGPQGTGPYTYTLQTTSNHYLAPGQVVLINNVSPSIFDGQFPIFAVIDPTHFQIQLGTNPTAPGALSDGEAIGIAFQALSADGGTTAVVEGNRICNTYTGGPYHDTWNSRDMMVRNNYFRAIRGGPYENLTAGMASSIPIPLASPFFTWSTGVVTVTTASPHGLIQGDAVFISGTNPPQYGGSFAVIAVTATTFEYALPNSPGGPSASGSCARIWQLDRLVVENNQLDLIPTPVNWGPPCGIQLGFGSPLGPFPRFQQAVLRRNSVRQVDGLPDPTGLSKAATVEVCGNLITEENVIDLVSSTPLWFSACGNIDFFANESLAGTLIQGYNFDSSASVSELSTDVEDSALLAF